MNSVQGWVLALELSLHAEFDQGLCKEVGEHFCKHVYEAGQRDDADLVLVAARHKSQVVVFAQVGCCLLFGPGIVYYLSRYLDNKDEPDCPSVKDILRRFVLDAADNFARNAENVMVPLKYEHAKRWRSFKAPFGNGMIGPDELPIGKNHDPSLN